MRKVLFFITALLCIVIVFFLIRFYGLFPYNYMTREQRSSLRNFTGSRMSTEEFYQEHSSELAWKTWSIVRAWSPQLPWVAPIKSTNEDAIPIDETRLMPPHTVGIELLRAVSVLYETFQSLSDARELLTMAIAPLGWKSALMFDADGPIGTSWGYILEDSKGPRFLIISILDRRCTPSDDTPFECKAFEVQAVVTEAIDLKKSI